jgi:hypothetical protein
MTVVRSVNDSPSGRSVLSHAGRKMVPFARCRLKSRICVRGATTKTGILENEPAKEVRRVENSFV